MSCACVSVLSCVCEQDRHPIHSTSCDTSQITQLDLYFFRYCNYGGHLKKSRRVNKTAFKLALEIGLSARFVNLESKPIFEAKQTKKKQTK